MNNHIYTLTLRLPVEFKSCKKCKEKKSMESFEFVKLRKDGRSVTCKACKRGSVISKTAKKSEDYYTRIRYET